MAMGRKKLPTEIKKIQGTLRKSREIKNQVNMELIIQYPSPPEYLSKYAINVWNKTIPDLYNKNLLANVDMDLITAYCIEMGRYNEANDIINKNKSPLTKSPSGYAMIHPWYTVARQSLKSALEIGCNFGLTAAARTKISATNNKKKDLSDMLKPKKIAGA